MVRRFLCLGVILLLIVLGVPACQRESTTKKAVTVQDPDAGAKPNVVGGARGG
jgi:hypothetical protein